MRICVNDKSVQFQLMRYDYTLYLLTTHLDYPNYRSGSRMSVFCARVGTFVQLSVVAIQQWATTTSRQPSARHIQPERKLRANVQ